MFLTSASFELEAWAPIEHKIKRAISEIKGKVMIIFSGCLLWMRFRKYSRRLNTASLSLWGGLEADKSSKFGSKKRNYKSEVCKEQFKECKLFKIIPLKESWSCDEGEESP